MNQSEWQVTFREVKRKQMADCSPQSEKIESSGTTFLGAP